MNPKLTDDAVGRLPLEGGRADLFDEVVATGDPRRLSPALSARTRRWLVPVAAAVVVAGVATSTVWWDPGAGAGSPSPGAAAEPSPSMASSSIPPPVASTGPSSVDSPSDASSSVAPPVASSGPGTALPSSPSGYRAVLDAPGWTATSTEGGDPYGEVDYTKGDARFDITWYGADSYDSYVQDREHIVTPPAPGDPVEVLGAAGQLWAYGADDHTVIREVRNGHWMELRGSGVSLADYRDLLGRVRLVDLDQFEASLPTRFVTQGEQGPRALSIIGAISDVAGADFPSGSSFSLRSPQQDPYQLGAEVAGAYACAWLGDYVDATRSGDMAEAAKAVEVMGTSRQWPVLQQMDAAGDYPEVVWGYADQIAAGTPPEGYRSALGC